jgi:hypothetical protein
MSQWPLRFGGNLPQATIDGVRLSPRCFGQGLLEATNPAAFAAAAEPAGGPDALVAWVQNAVVSQVGPQFEQVATTKGALSAMSAMDSPEVRGAIAERLSAQLAQAGARVQVDSLTITLSEDEIEALKAAQMQAVRAKMAQMLAQQAPAPLGTGSAVLATWSDGNTYAGTIQASQNGYFQIAWDAGGGAWVPIANVRAR